jgi:hypothetical protein
MSQSTPISRSTALAVGAASATLTLAALVTVGGMLGVIRSPSATKPAVQGEEPASSIVLVPVTSTAAPEPSAPGELPGAPATGATRDDDDDDDDNDHAEAHEAHGERRHRAKHHEGREHGEHDDG